MNVTCSLSLTACLSSPQLTWLSKACALKQMAPVMFVVKDWGVAMGRLTQKSTTQWSKLFVGSYLTTHPFLRGVACSPTRNVSRGTLHSPSCCLCFLVLTIFCWLTFLCLIFKEDTCLLGCIFLEKKRSLENIEKKETTKGVSSCYISKHPQFSYYPIMSHTTSPLTWTSKLSQIPFFPNMTSCITLVTSFSSPLLSLFLVPLSPLFSQASLHAPYIAGCWQMISRQPQ